MLCIADSIPESRSCLDLAKKYEQIFCTVGVHPHHAKDWEEGDRALLASLAQASSKVRAVGEIGLDYHYDFSPREVQRAVFDAQLQLAQDFHLPAVVHCRNAIADVRKALEKMDLTKVVLHCCTEAWKDVADLVTEGMRLSFTGIATYPQADTIRQVIRQCPMSQIMVETDAPYLAPVPHRGKRNEPAFVWEVARLIANLKDVSLEEADRVTTANAVAFFGLPS